MNLSYMNYMAMTGSCISSFWVADFSLLGGNYCISESLNNMDVYTSPEFRISFVPFTSRDFNLHTD